MKRNAVEPPKKKPAEAAAAKEERGYITLRVEWLDSIERITLNLDRRYPDDEPIDTNEIWITRGGGCNYQPRISRYVASDDGLTFALTYDKADYTKSMLELDLDWGEAQYEVSLATRVVKVTWRSGRLEATDPLNVPGELIRGDELREVELILQRRTKRQGDFRANLVKRFYPAGAYCALTDEKLESVLEAAHVVGVGDGGPDVPENGMLLRIDLHRLYDAKRFSIDPDGRVLIPDQTSLPEKEQLSDYYRTLLTEHARLHENVHERVVTYLQQRNRVSMRSNENAASW